MFIAALFITGRTWKQPRCPSVDEWIRKLWDIYTMEYYSAVKKNSFESVLMRWMKLEPIIQSEVSQKDIGDDWGSDHELLIANFRLKLKKVGETTGPFRYDLNQIKNRFKRLDLIDKVPDELWMRVHNIV